MTPSGIAMQLFCRRRNQDHYAEVIPDDPWVAVHKEFDHEHRAVTTLAVGNNGKGNGFQECQDWCDRANKSGFNYRPYRRSAIKRT